MSRRQRRHSDEFKREALRMVEAGQSQAEVARNLGIHVSLLGKWKAKYSAEEAVSELTEDERLELARLRAENKRLKMERDILKKATAFLRERESLRFEFIEQHHEVWPVTIQCEVLQVSRSGFYAWRSRPESQRSKRQAALASEIASIHSDPDMKSYGSPRVHQELLARGFAVSENTVARLMRACGFRASSSRKFRVTTDSRHSLPVAENVLNRHFQQDQPDRVWLADITSIWTREGWLYLACVLDACSRKVVGWSMSDRMKEDLVLDALRDALGRRRPAPDGGLLHHSDRGSQYAGRSYQELLREANISCSMSRRGNCWDNAMMESFFATLKKERVHQEEYATRSAARASVFDYIERFYNRIRLHSALDYMSPDQFEQNL
ncbi:MAG: IS3 family transposase [Maioricimonas sp. JB045]